MKTAEPKVPSVRIGHPLPFDSRKVGRVRLIASDSKSDRPLKVSGVRILHLPPLVPRISAITSVSGTDEGRSTRSGPTIVDDPWCNGSTAGFGPVSQGSNP